MSAAAAGLIADQDGRIFRFVQPPDGRRGKGKHMKTADVIQVADFFGDSSIAIEENGRPKRRGFSQRPPPQSRASHALLLRPLPAAHLSCNDGRSASFAQSTASNRIFL